jgi:hypothetical protein
MARARGPSSRSRGEATAAVTRMTRGGEGHGGPGRDDDGAGKATMATARMMEAHDSGMRQVTSQGGKGG